MLELVQGDEGDEEAQLAEAARGEQREADEEEAAVARAHADAHPGTVVVVAQHTAPTQLEEEDKNGLSLFSLFSLVSFVPFNIY